MIKKVFSLKKLLIFISIIVILLCAFMVFTYFYLIGPSEKNGKEVVVYVSEGQTYSSISSLLKDNKLIKSKVAYKIYIKLNNPKDLEYGNYTLNTSYNVKDIIETMKKGSENPDTIKTVTFIEGKNMRYVIDTIVKEFDITEEEILNTLNDSTYLDSLIEKYWFLTKDIKNKNIYYSLEGYLYPDTYEFYTNAKVKDIFKKMLDNLEIKLSNYKEEIESSKYSIHEMITLSSIIELEAGNASDRKGVAGVFYNRLSNNWSLGSDVTTYYAEKIDNFLRDLKQTELDSCNAYNTRSSCMSGKLPVGPICNAGLKSIESAIEPTKHKYYFFVADKNGKTYFSKTNSEHVNTVSKLKKEGLWIEYES